MDNEIGTNADGCVSANIKPSTLNKDHHVAPVQPAWHAGKVITFGFGRELVVYLSATNVIRYEMGM